MPLRVLLWSQARLINLVLRLEAIGRVALRNRRLARLPRPATVATHRFRIDLPSDAEPRSAVIHAHGYPVEIKEREWSDLAIRAGAPGFAIHEDLLYLPAGDALPQSGLYDRDGQPATESVLFRGETQMSGLAKVAPWDPRPGLAVEERDAIYLGHVSSIGHFLTETLSRVWVRDACGLADPVWVFHGADPRVKPWGAELLRHAGIPLDRLVRYAAPTRLRRVVVPRPALELNAGIWSIFPEFMADLGARVLGRSVVRRSEQPLYLSRERMRPRQRIHGNEGALSAWLRARGTRIVHFQDMPIAEQVRAINTHATVIGPVGSAHHLNLLAGRPARHIYLARSLGPQTYMLVDAAKGNASHWIRARDLPSRLKRGKSPHLQNTLIDLDLSKRVLTDLGV